MVISLLTHASGVYRSVKGYLLQVTICHDFYHKAAMAIRYDPKAIILCPGYFLGKILIGGQIF